MKKIKVKDSPNEIIRIREWPTDYAEKAYKKKHYIEAIQVLHGFIENKLQELLMLMGALDYKLEFSEIWNIANQISLNNSVKVLYVTGQIKKSEYQAILKFNSMRNNIIHNLFHETYKEGVKGVSKKEFDIAFESGLKLCDLLQTITEERE